MRRRWLLSNVAEFYVVFFALLFADPNAAQCFRLIEQHRNNVTAPVPLAMVLRRHLREQGMADFKLPDRSIQVDNMALTPIGKVDKSYCASVFPYIYRPRLRKIDRWPLQNLMMTRCQPQKNWLTTGSASSWNLNAQRS